MSHLQKVNFSVRGRQANSDSEHCDSCNHLKSLAVRLSPQAAVCVFRLFAGDSSPVNNHKFSVRTENSQGGILLITLLIITILVTIVLETQYKIQIYQAGAAYTERKSACTVLARSGLALAKALLDYDRKEKNKSDHPGEIWAHPDEQDEVDLPEPENGQIILKISDEQARFPINCLVTSQGKWRYKYRRVFFNLLTGPCFRLSQEKALKIMAAIKDWLDRDAIPQTGDGFEQEYYNQHHINVKVRNGPLQYVAELQDIAGITEEIYAGRHGRPGLKDLVTVYSDGKVNINTASSYLLCALINQDEGGVDSDEAWQFATAMVDYRQNSMHYDELASTGWYNNLSGSLNIHFPDFIAIKSDYFSVLSTARIGLTQAQIWTVWHLRKDRDSLKLRTLFMEFS